MATTGAQAREPEPVRRWHWAPLATTIVSLIISLYFVIGGVYLLTLSGTPYYLLVGVGLCLTGVLLLLHRGLALWIYAAILIGTIVWYRNRMSR